MSDELCVCGHDANAHKLVKRARDGKVIGRFHCEVCAADPKRRCARYKPVLDWPDAEGWYYATLGPDRFGKSYKTMALATLGENGYGGPVVMRISTVEQGTYYRDDATMHFGPMAFTKAESNPFKDTQ